MCTEVPPPDRYGASGQTDRGTHRRQYPQAESVELILMGPDPWTRPNRHPKTALQLRVRRAWRWAPTSRGELLVEFIEKGRREVPEVADRAVGAAVLDKRRVVEVGWGNARRRGDDVDDAVEPPALPIGKGHSALLLLE